MGGAGLPDVAVLVTRPEGQGEGLCAALGDAGFRPLAEPLLTLHPLPAAAGRARTLAGELDLFQHCIFISGNAARFGLAALLQHRSEWPSVTACYAVGDSTASVLRGEGIAVLTPGTEMTSEGLLALPPLKAVRGQRVLIVKGEGGRGKLRDELAARGAEVETFACYRRAPAGIDGAALRARLEREAVRAILISSGEGLAHLSALLRPGENTKLARVALIVPSTRVADQARQAGWRQLAVAKNAADAAMLSTLRRWWSQQRKSR